jgi:hypothetical protein
VINWYREFPLEDFQTVQLQHCHGIHVTSCNQIFPVVQILKPTRYQPLYYILLDSL